MHYWFYDRSLWAGKNLHAGCIWPTGQTLDMPALNISTQRPLTVYLTCLILTCFNINTCCYSWYQHNKLDLEECVCLLVLTYPLWCVPAEAPANPQCTRSEHPGRWWLGLWWQPLPSTWLGSARNAAPFSGSLQEPPMSGHNLPASFSKSLKITRAF